MGRVPIPVGGLLLLLEFNAMSHAATRLWGRTLILLAILVVSHDAPPVRAAAQQLLPGAETEDLLQGIVVHQSTGEPVESATVSLVDTNIETRSGPYGGFSFPDAPLGFTLVRVTAPGHPGVVEEVEVKSDGIVFVQFILPSINAVLDELLVQVPGDAPRASQLTAADLLAIQVPSTRVLGDDVGRTDYRIRLRGAASSFTLGQEPLVLVDGVMVSRLGRALDVLRQIPASNVVSIKVLRGPAAAVEYPMAANGVVLVTTHAQGGRPR